MNTVTHDFPVFEALTGWVVLLSLLTFAFSSATLRFHVDEEKLRQEKNISLALRSPIPPERILTTAGKRRVKIAKIALVVFAASAAIIVVRNLVHGP